MLVLLKPTSEEFDEMTTTCHDSVREVFKHYVTDNDILAYSTDATIVFLAKEEIADLWDRFVSNNEKVDSKLIRGLEQTKWEDTYQEEFFQFVTFALEISSTSDTKFFSHIMDEVYSNYMGQGWRLPTIEELSAMFNKNINKALKGFKSAYYWSSSTNASSDNFAWLVNFDKGCAGYSTKSYNGCVRCVRNVANRLELSPVSEDSMTWQEAMDYAKTLQVDPKDITTVKLNGWYYEEVKTEKTYVVRVEVDVKECDLGEIEVKANSREEAIEKAIACYNNDELPLVDLWSSDFRETELAVNTKDNWEVIVKEKN